MQIKVNDQSEAGSRIHVRIEYPRATEIRERIEKELDASYQLVYIDYRDEMPEDVLKAYVNEGEEKARQVFYEDNDEWISDAQSDAMYQIIQDLTTDEEYELLHRSEEINLLIDEIYNRDSSDPFSDLMRNASSQWMTYDLDLELDAPEYDMIPHPEFGEVAQARIDQPKQIAQHLGLDVNDKKIMDALIELSSNAGYGGQLQLLLREDVTAFDGLIDGEEYVIHDPQLAIIAYYPGAGHDVKIEGSITIKWDRSRLEMNNFYADDVCGLYAPAYAGTRISKKEDQ